MDSTEFSKLETNEREAAEAVQRARVAMFDANREAGARAARYAALVRDHSAAKALLARVRVQAAA